MNEVEKTPIFSLSDQQIQEIETKVVKALPNGDTIARVSLAFNLIQGRFSIPAENIIIKYILNPHVESERETSYSYVWLEVSGKIINPAGQNLKAILRSPYGEKFAISVATDNHELRAIIVGKKAGGPHAPPRR
jgi:hypothetical protein